MKLSDFTNLSGQFVKPSGEGFLLSSLGIFTSRPSDTQIIALDTLEDVQREVTKSVARYGSEMSGLSFPRAANVTVTSPLHVYSSTITSQDWQGKRQPGTNRQMTAEDVVANHTVKHYLQTRRDVEYAMFNIRLLKKGISCRNYFFYTTNGKFKLSTGNISTLCMIMMMKCAYRTFFKFHFYHHQTLRCQSRTYRRNSCRHPKKRLSDCRHEIDKHDPQ